MSGSPDPQEKVARSLLGAAVHDVEYEGGTYLRRCIDHEAHFPPRYRQFLRSLGDKLLETRSFESTLAWAAAQNLNGESDLLMELFEEGHTYPSHIFEELLSRITVPALLLDLQSVVEKGHRSSGEILDDVDLVTGQYREHDIKEITLLGVEEILKLEPPDWLVPGWISEQSLAVLWGAPGTGKSFLALDFCLSLAASVEWNSGGQVERPTLFMAGEGVAGLPLRIRAWQQAKGVGTERLAKFLVYPASFSFFDQDFATFIVELRRLKEPPALTVIDTLNRYFGGKNENDQADMGAFVQRCADIQRETGGAVLIVHHGDKEGKWERGSSVLTGAADTVMKLQEREAECEEKVISLTCEKQKDTEIPKPVVSQLKVIDIEGCDGERSVYLRSGLNFLVDMSKSSTEAALLEALVHGFSPQEGATTSEWMTAFEGKRSHFYKLRKRLLGRNLIEQIGNGKGVKWRPTGPAMDHFSPPSPL